MEINESISKYRQDIKSDRVDMSFGEIINMYKENEIVISPEYQRAFRWDKERQTAFIESILLGIPFPSIFVATNEDGTWELIDGLQRVSTVLSFFGELKDSFKNNLVLTAGDIVSDLEGLTINTIPMDLKLAIKRTACRVEIIQRDSHFEMRYELFKRLNTGGEGLTRQEIRNCIFRGFPNYQYFTEVLHTCSNNETYRRLVVLSDEAKEQMMYDELFLRFFALFNFRHRYTEKTIQDFFDKIMREQCEKPNKEMIQVTMNKFDAILEYLKPLDENIFKLARLNLSTSMYDSIMLTLAITSKNFSTIPLELFKANIIKLKEDSDFHSKAGASSSNAKSIRDKLVIAQRILLGEVDD